MRWQAVGPVQFPEPLTPLQQKCKKGAKFKEDGESWEVLGLEWGSKQKDYVVFYVKQSERRHVRLLSDKIKDGAKAEVEHTPFKTTYEGEGDDKEVAQAGFADESLFQITWE